MGRLAPGASLAQVRASLEPIFQEAAYEGWLAGRPAAGRLEEPTPDAPTLGAEPGAQGENDLRRKFAKPLRMLMGLVGLVLAAACANVANLLLARSAARRREIALRLALGARRGRIVRQLLTESVLLALAGAVLGTVLAWWSRDLLLALRPFGNAPVVLDLPLDARVLGFTIAVTVATALIFGLAPALRATRVDLSAQFQSGARTIGSGGRSRLTQTLMVVQIALSLVLLVSTGLFVRTLGNLQNVDAGFNRRGLVLFRIDATSAGYSREQYARLQSRLQEKLEAVPGVRAATFSSVALLSSTRQNKRITVPGRTPPSRDVDGRQYQRPRAELLRRHGAAARRRSWIHRARRRRRAAGRRGQPDVRADVFGRREPRRPPHHYRSGSDRSGRDRRRRRRREIHRATRCGSRDDLLAGAPAARRQCELRGAPRRAGARRDSRRLCRRSAPSCARSIRRSRC